MLSVLLDIVKCFELFLKIKLKPKKLLLVIIIIIVYMCIYIYPTHLDHYKFHNGIYLFMSLSPLSLLYPQAVHTYFCPLLCHFVFQNGISVLHITASFGLWCKLGLHVPEWYIPIHVPLTSVIIMSPGRTYIFLSSSPWSFRVPEQYFCSPHHSKFWTPR